MKKSRLWLAIFPVISLLFGSSSYAGQQESKSPRDRLAEAYGIRKFDNVEELRYTFNVKLPDRTVSRTWSWEPKKDRVTFRGTAEQGGTVAYDRSDLAKQPTEQVKKVDASFVNDNYWLIFPLRLSWDQTAAVTAYQAPVKLPIGTGQAQRLVVKYPDNEGYTPGDVYELFIDKSSRIVQWIYRKGGDIKPTRITTWEDYNKVGPLTLSLDHRSPDGVFRVWFTDVAVRLAGKSDWITAK
jgi:hypothetical protein